MSRTSRNYLYDLHEVAQVSARFDARYRCLHGKRLHWSFLDDLWEYRRARRRFRWSHVKAYNSKDCTLRTHRTGR